MNDLLGGSRKTRKREPKRTTAKEVASDTVSSQATEESNTVPGGDLAASSLLTTPKRCRGRKGRTLEAHLTSTPVRGSSADILSSISKSSTRAKQVELEYTEVITQLKVFDHMFTDIVSAF